MSSKRSVSKRRGLKSKLLSKSAESVRGKSVSKSVNLTRGKWSLGAEVDGKSDRMRRSRDSHLKIEETVNALLYWLPPHTLPNWSC